MKQKDVLWISMTVPYDTVGHAGGKIHNYYLKYLNKHGNGKVRLLSFFWAREKDKIDLDKYQIEHALIERKVWAFPDLLFNLESVLNPWNRYAGINQNYIVMQLKKVLKSWVKEGYQPEVVILQWTEMIVLTDFVKKCFPKAKYIAIEEDVKFQNFERQLAHETNPFKKWIKNIRFKRLQKIELAACKQADYLIMNNPKDVKILHDYGIEKEKLLEWVPYYDSFLDRTYVGDKKQIIYYGAMGRRENVLAASWFAEKVMPLLEDTEVEFAIIGSRPDESLQKYASDRIKILGFVEDIGVYFEHALCLAAPIREGAGIKIKILESLSAGIPVLTTDVGIEGIPAKPGRDFFLCDTAEEFADSIRLLLNNPEQKKTMSENARTYMETTYDMEATARMFVDLVEKL